MDNQRKTLRQQATQEAQAAAEDVLQEIIEEKKKLAEIKKEFNKKSRVYILKV